MNIGITGYTGRVGALLINELQSGKWNGLMLAGATSRKMPETDPGFFVTTDPEELFKRADCVIDFTTPEATLFHADLAAKTGTQLVVGTTGLSIDHEKALQKAAEHTGIVYAANMSVGVNLLMALVEQAATRLASDWDIEIFEAHHRHKVDSPSGTALALGRAAAEGRNKNPASSTYSSLKNAVAKEGNAFVFDREGKRIDGEIGFAVSRGGDVVGEHSVTFYTEGERLELGHKASDRSLFAKGALRAAAWLDGKPHGLYTMRDVLFG
ncbi:MAG: 4-hydroxy-tetrahydrodipicolinate reductase [Alphaproteobacteria bacterium]|nr:4-hydroxy-tetrahydrodipicolinate reductase [Alphaproteobacteria bacterium]